MIEIVVFSLIGIGVFFSILRMIIGPEVTDRIVSLDTMNVMITGIIVLLSHIFKNEIYLDIAIVYGVLSFLETVVLSRYLEAKK
ncbi:cation:proton antiporter [Petrotoga sp. HWH.PT.55.6.1]|jgi:multicomponent Na+:H+ antiporter subunit F|uniref:Cation:proton antiporter n=1 Tax=Petrotoga halophila DSM 16923 TaxID=1122953 RepID=A0A2S5EHZ9_9BACT|nr:MULTISPECIES: monovalent cation/H+ antiporter complex subunit F [Petrotoga]MBL5980664.1 cation:proton antiporter [Petrotoga sp. 8T1HF07.NaAc.6.1]POZ92638.1 cation:proton antiporter [Petrotoga halophila DSM 16923]RLL84543.1 cation:proton antiporter [Petrotoga sp. Shatin.DS.tank11.9.2.9.3]RLL89571.1 cation:proton antiporter [Petrotoga sp. HKA.pet.4.5]RPD36253.1 cation:proton antiporter [Petrotoga sp. HWH.PT.55.6.1]